MAFFHSFHGWVIFHCVYVPHLLYPFLCWCTFRLFPCLAYCIQCCSEYWSTCVFSFFLSFFFLSFLGPHLWHVDVPRLGVCLELQLPAYAIATATPDPSHICCLHHSSQQHQILNPLSEAKNQTRNFMVPGWICLPLSPDRNSLPLLFSPSSSPPPPPRALHCSFLLPPACNMGQGPSHLATMKKKLREPTNDSAVKSKGMTAFFQISCYRRKLNSYLFKPLYGFFSYFLPNIFLTHLQ